MVAGMYVHERFLEVRPATQERRGRVLYEHYRATVDPQAPPLAALRERLPDAFLEHCYRHPDPASFRRVWESLRFAHIAASLASTAVLIVDEADCLADSKGARVVRTSRLPAAVRPPANHFPVLCSRTRRTAAPADPGSPLEFDRKRPSGPLFL